MVAHSLWVRGAVGSNPATPTVDWGISARGKREQRSPVSFLGAKPPDPSRRDFVPRTPWRRDFVRRTPWRRDFVPRTPTQILTLIGADSGGTSSSEHLSALDVLGGSGSPAVLA